MENIIEELDKYNLSLDHFLNVVLLKDLNIPTLFCDVKNFDDYISIEVPFEYIDETIKYIKDNLWLCVGMKRIIVEEKVYK